MHYSELATRTFYRGRVGLYGLLRSLGIGAGDRVAAQAFTCLAVPEAIMASGARPRFIDIEADGFNMDPSDLARKVTHEVRAIVVQHTFGIPARMEAILQVAERTGVPVIEDCCHTLASRINGRVVGTFGAASFYSFEWGKPLIAGIGGSVIVNDARLLAELDAWADRLQRPSLFSQLKLELQYVVFDCCYRPEFYWPLKSAFHLASRVGAAEGNYNPVLEGEQAAGDFSRKMAPLPLSRLKKRLSKIDCLTAHSRSIAGQYRRRIRSSSVEHPRQHPGVDTVFARYPLRVSNKERLLAETRRANLEMSDWYRTPIHPLTCDQWPQVHYEAGSCPEAERRATQIVSLPTHQRVGSRYVTRISDFLNSSSTESRQVTQREAA